MRPCRGVVRSGAGAAHLRIREKRRDSIRSRTESTAQIMYGTSDPLVGYAYRKCFKSVAGTPDRIARANRLITSQVSATRRLEYQSEVSWELTRRSSSCSRAAASVRPTPASGGTVNTTL